MSNTADNIKNSEVFEIKLAIDTQPKNAIDPQKRMVKWGKDNNYPSKLLFWFNNHAEHGAIVKGKARYLSGLKIKTDLDVPAVNEFLEHANPRESWYDLRKKCELDEVLSGGYYLMVISNVLGTPVEWYHMDFAKCRMSECGEYVLISEDWSGKNHWRVGYETYPLWQEGLVGISIYRYKNYAPSDNKLSSYYSKPEYESCSLDIDTDMRVSTFFNAYIRNNFSAGRIVTIFNGETDPEKKATISDKLKGNYEGEDNGGKTVVVFTTENGKATEITAIDSNNLEKQFQEVYKRSLQKILVGHGVNGELFKVRQEAGKMGRTEIVENHELLVNEYAKPGQIPFNKTVELFCKLRTGYKPNIDVEQIKPIGIELDLNNQNVINALNAKNPDYVFNYIMDKFGLEEIETELAPGEVEQGGVVNEHLKNLTGRQRQSMLAIVRQFKNGQLNQEQATLMLKTSLNFTDSQALTMLGVSNLDPVVQQSKQDKSTKFFELFDKYAHNINFEDETLDVQNVKFKSVGEMLQFEKVKFAELKITTDLKNSILNEYKGDPTVKSEVLARKYDISEDLVNKITSNLIKGKLLNEDFTPTTKALDKTTEPRAETTEIYTEYVYAKRADLPGATVIPTTRDFCRQLVERTQSKALSFEAIFSMENDLGENVWDYRGGFYTNPKTNETTPWCRHVWSAVTKIRKVKK